MDWTYDSWPSGEPYNWGGAARGHGTYDSFDPHVDLGCGTVKKGRIGIDCYPAPGVNIVMDLDSLVVWGLPSAPGEDAVDGIPPRHALAATPAIEYPGLPFDRSSIESIISHHALEHIGGGFIALMDEVYRVLKPGGMFRAITPLFPSLSAVSDPTHKRFFTEETWNYLCGHLGSAENPTGCWMDSFAVPYTKARFELVDKDITPPSPPEKAWTPDDAREIRVALRAVK